jgi:2-polyprenyl-3-methyl-5-hydroxy-6-metoxy-1,4-benzoquinol methylase
LDVGCGTGGFLSALRETGGWRTVGVEVDERLVAYARQALGLTVHQGDLSTLNESAHSFDAVTMWDVLEHLIDPLGTLHIIRRLLKPDGVLLLSTPNAQAWQARLWGENWAGWNIPLHTYFFTPATLKRILARAGFRVIKRLSFPADRFYLVESWRRKLARGSFTFATSRWRQVVWRWSRRFTSAAGVVLWPGLRLLDFADRGSQIAVVAVLDSNPRFDQ